MEQPGNIPIFNIPGTLFRKIPQNFIGNFFRMCWEYHEYSANILVGNSLVRKVTTFIKSSMFDVWHGSISLQFLKNLKLNRPINVDYQYKSNSVTEGYALFINMDHKHGFVKTSCKFSNWTNALHWPIHNKSCLSKNGIARQYSMSLGK